MTINEKLKHKYALSDYGARGMLRAFLAVTLANLVLMMPVGLLYALVRNLLSGSVSADALPFFACGIVAADSGGKAPQAAAIVLRKKGLVGLDQHDYGRLRGSGNCLFALDS